MFWVGIGSLVCGNAGQAAAPPCCPRRLFLVQVSDSDSARYFARFAQAPHAHVATCTLHAHLLYRALHSPCGFTYHSPISPFLAARELEHLQGLRPHPRAPPALWVWWGPTPSLRPPRSTSAHCWARWAVGGWPVTGPRAFPTLRSWAGAQNKWRGDHLR